MDAGYSATPLVSKLGYKPGQRALLINPPEEYFAWLGGAPDGVEFAAQKKLAAGSLGLIHLFVMQSAELSSELSRLLPALEDRGSIWVSWPKKAMAKKLGLASDISEDRIRDIAMPMRLVDVKVCAVSEVWSGLKLVRRLKR